MPSPLGRSAALSLLVALSVGCGLEESGYADPGSCGGTSCDPWLPWEPPPPHVTLRFDVTGLTSEHAGDSYRFVSTTASGEIVATYLIPVTTLQVGVSVPRPAVNLSYLGLVDTSGSDVTGYGCTSSTPTRRIVASDQATLDQHFRMTCGPR